MIVPEVGRVYKTLVDNLVKVVNIDESTDRLQVYNFSQSCNVWTSLSKHNLKTLIR
jgi:hypothetical protein